MNITADLLLMNGFKKQPMFPGTSAFHAICYSIWTGDASPLKIDVDDGLNGEYMNSSAEWHVHIDNSSCETVGSAELTTVEQFNKFMEVFDSCFRLDSEL